MIFDNINITEQLKNERAKFPSLLNEVNDLLLTSSKKDEAILNRLKEGNDNDIHDVVLLQKDAENIYSIKEIESICVTYRLRFLDSKHFKMEFPYDAVVRINEFEKQYNTKIKRFKIIAPHKAFDLMDVNQDPLLFAQLSNNTFYLLHQWGTDLKWYRKYLFFPVRSIYTYFYSIIVLAFLFSFSFPFQWLQVQRDNEIYIRVWFAMHCTIGFFFFIIFLGAITQSSFSSMSWKSKYFNE